ncbi:MAG: hypothetical protein K2K53_11995 [Oscillospiraceae bacterium]|nr:hypothetical protein [Oscillospiraceae bacterium]
MSMDFETNGKLEALEKHLYERLTELVDSNRFDDAGKVLNLMREAGIV